MNQTPQERAAPLEDQLRNMILSNVTISGNNQTNQEGSPRGQQNRHRPSHAHGPPRNTRWQASPGGDGSVPTSTQRRDKWKPRPHQQFQHNSTPSGGANGAQNGPSPSNMPYKGYPRQRQQNTHQRQTPHAVETSNQRAAPGPPGLSILHRPQQSPPGLPNQSPASPMGQFPPRYQGYSIHTQQMNHQPENPMIQVEFLDRLASHEVPKVEISLAELEAKDAFRIQLEGIFKDAMAQGYSGPMTTIDLVGFGSLASGFGMPGSDMDLAIVPGWKDASDAQKIEIDREIPRILERAVLDSRLGARLLTRTRVPILKVCQQPSEELYQALFDERKKWDELAEEEKYPPPPPPPEPPSMKEKPIINVDSDDFPALGKEPQPKGKMPKAENNLKIDIGTSNAPKSTGPKSSSSKQPSPSASAQSTASQVADAGSKDIVDKDKSKHHEKPWLREKALGPLDFPKSGIGIQCDINFENPLGIHNTHLLRCYSLCDPRVRPMVLFVKAWAKRRKINSAYSGTLSSYGWVLMVLHYLVNVAQPPICPNLQHCYRQPTDIAALEKMFKETMVAGYAVRFWRNESEILEAARAGQLTRNTQSLGALLRGFFHYFASPNTGFTYGPRPPSFYWTTEVLSLRTPNGLLSKQSKGWTGAKTTIQAGKEVRNRYLFAIEDPFEIDHNVARTVTHNGIVAIRDEFRRAWRILQAIGRNVQPEGGIFDEVVEQAAPPSPEKIAEKVVTMETLVLDDVEGKPGPDQKEKEIGSGE